MPNIVYQVVIPGNDPKVAAAALRIYEELTKCLKLVGLPVSPSTTHGSGLKL